MLQNSALWGGLFWLLIGGFVVWAGHDMGLGRLNEPGPGFAFYWIAAAPALFWARWETWLLTTTVVLYALPYWVTMSHPTYHFPVMAPLALLGALAWQLVRSSGTGSRARGWAALVMLALIQVEWAFYLAQG